VLHPKTTKTSETVTPINKSEQSECFEKIRNMTEANSSAKAVADDFKQIKTECMHTVLSTSSANETCKTF